MAGNVTESTFRIKAVDDTQKAFAAVSMKVVEIIVNTVKRGIENVNKLIAIMNKIPKVDIPSLGTEGLDGIVGADRSIASDFSGACP